MPTLIYLIHHHPRSPWATGPYASEEAALRAAGRNPLPCDCSILRGTVTEEGTLGRCVVYPPIADAST